MRILIVKLSSLGDVVHAMPVVHDIREAFPGALIDWVVEPSFAPLVRRVRGVSEVIECGLRRWSKAWWTRPVRIEWQAFRKRLARVQYDAVIDLQGLTKSGLIARLARGPSYGLANRTDGSSFEWPARWLVDHAIHIPPHIHALDRSRELAARALGFRFAPAPVYGLQVRAHGHASLTVALVHGTSRGDKLWPEFDWVALGKRLIESGLCVAFPHGNEAERERAQRLADALGEGATVWPRLGLDALLGNLNETCGVIGVDSGLSHIAVALGLPHVQIYNFPTAWRTGPQTAHGHAHQVSVQAEPSPSLDAVWDAWCTVRRDTAHSVTAHAVP